MDDLRRLDRQLQRQITAAWAALARYPLLDPAHEQAGERVRVLQRLRRHVRANLAQWQLQDYRRLEVLLQRPITVGYLVLTRLSPTSPAYAEVQRLIGDLRRVQRLIRAARRQAESHTR